MWNLYHSFGLYPFPFEFYGIPKQSISVLIQYSAVLLLIFFSFKQSHNQPELRNHRQLQTWWKLSEFTNSVALRSLSSFLFHSHFCSNSALNCGIDKWGDRFWSGKMWKLEIQKKARFVWGTKLSGLISLMFIFGQEFIKSLLYLTLQVSLLYCNQTFINICSCIGWKQRLSLHLVSKYCNFTISCVIWDSQLFITNVWI